MDHAAWLQQDTGEDAQKAYAYFMRPDPDQREFSGPPQYEHDPVTGMTAKFRLGRVGMVRNAPEDQMREVKVYLGFDDKPSLPHIRLDNAKPLQGWYQPKHNDKQGSRPRPCYTDAILTEPYGGYCTVGCAFCYVNSGFRGYRGSGLISVPVNYGQQVQGMLDKMRTSAAGYFSSFTDCFLPLEDVYHNTQQAAEVFDRAGLPVFFLSRMSYPGWAIDLLTRNRYSYAQKSINTSDPEDWAKLSPGAISLAQHMDEIRELSRRGIYVSIQVNPIIAGVTSHEDIERLFEMLAEAGARHVIVKFVEAGYSWANAMVERITKRFGDNRAAAFRELFVENQCGAQRTVSREYRLEAHRRYQAKATAVGLTYATCYEYDKGPDGQWRSIGGDFLTGDQCHGHRVPMFTRRDLSQPFREVEECPPSGCLTCTDGNGGKPRCGSELFGSAKALRMPDLKEAVR
jgi:DNA repair photolyase